MKSGNGSVVVHQPIRCTVFRALFLEEKVLKSTDAPGISEVLLNELKKVVDNPDKLIGQTFDGAAVMRGDKSGVKVKVQSIYKYAHYVHCYAHQLNLILKSSAKSKNSNRFFSQLTAISNYFSRSPNKVKVLSEHIS